MALKTRPVGSYKPNAWGILDMHGNVAEWCLDADRDTRGPQLWNVRGGMFFLDARQARSAARSSHQNPYHTSSIGFRVARVRSGR
jgi:formylglycine-generating enzyme required for sulfatase activity